jgi:uncharacterized protein (DUF4415 family)
MEIEFDPEKADANPLNHDGVTFDEAKGVLLDPYALTREDTPTSSTSSGSLPWAWAGRGGFWLWCGRRGVRPCVSYPHGRPINLNGGAMNNSSDPMFDRYADMDFSIAKPVVEVPELAKLQAAYGGKSRITMRVDTTTLAVFKARAEMCGGNYQTMMNEALRQYAEGLTLADVVRETIRQELHHS